MVEIWKDIEGYIGLYQVSSLGRVRSLPREIRNSRNENMMSTIKGRILSPSDNGGGYLHVGLCKNGTIKYHTIHRLVAKAFIPNELNLPEVNHKDCQPSNNSVDNLEWCTRHYNANYDNAPMKKVMSVTKPVAQIGKDGCVLHTFPSAKVASEFIGGCKSAITHCCNGRSKYSHGYKWRYIDV